MAKPKHGQSNKSSASKRPPKKKKTQVTVTRGDNYMTTARARALYREAQGNKATVAVSFREWVRTWKFGSATLAPKLQKIRIQIS